MSDLDSRFPQEHFFTEPNFMSNSKATKEELIAHIEKWQKFLSAAKKAITEEKHLVASEIESDGSDGLAIFCEFEYSSPLDPAKLMSQIENHAKGLK